MSKRNKHKGQPATAAPAPWAAWQLRRVVGDGNFDYLITLGEQEF